MGLCPSRESSPNQKFTKYGLLNFILVQNVREGSDELDIQKLLEQLELKFSSVYDALPASGNISDVREMLN